MADELLKPGDRVRHLSLASFGVGTVALDPLPDSPPGCTHVYWDKLPPGGVLPNAYDEPWAHATAQLYKVDQPGDTEPSGS